MLPFLRQIAAHYYKEYGEDIHRLCFVFQGRRAGLFFKRHLSGISAKPLFAPRTTNLKDLLLGLSPYKELDRTALLFELYNTYKEIWPQAEPFDQFIFWGDIILKDFNEIDKHLVSAKALYSNLKDFREMENDFSFLSERQVAAIRSFWESFSPASGQMENGCQQSFLDFWKLLSPLYIRFNQRLADQGNGYHGMILRHTVDRLRQRETSVRELLSSADRGGNADPDKYVFVGLFALSPAEEYILVRMKAEGICDFCFDDDLSLLHSAGNLTGTILDHNKEIFGKQTPWQESSENGQTSSLEDKPAPDIRIIRTASEIVQAKLLPQLIEELYPEGYSDKEGIETAIILPDTGMLMPVLNSLAETVGRINVTMGYPLSQSAISIFVEKWIRVQAEIRLIQKVPHFRTDAVLDLLNSVLLAPLLTDHSRDLLSNREVTKQYYVPEERLWGDELTDLLFSRPDSGQQLLDRLFLLLEKIAESMLFQPADSEYDQSEETNNMELEQIYHYRNMLNRLRGLVESYAMDMSVRSAALLLQGLVSGVSIPFEGEPLVGLQIMGIDQTRSLDFKHLIILSVNEGKLPSRVYETTMIPYTLRRGYGLPVNEVNEATQSYDFFRLIQRAESVTMLYDARSDQLGGGEESRYIRQMHFLFDMPLKVQELHLTGSLPHSPAICVRKEGEVLTRLHRFLEYDNEESLDPEENLSALSASSINTYVACPLRFYFENVREIREENASDELMAANDFGTVVHRSMELIYKPCCGGGIVSSDILSRWLDPKNATIARIVRQAYTEEYLRSANTQGALSGLNHLYCIMIEKYVRRILEHDKSLAPFRYIDSERRVKGSFSLSNGSRVRLHGIIDRIDELNEECRRIVDYKSGDTTTELGSWDLMFQHPIAGKSKKHPTAIAQTLLYALMAKMQMENEGEGSELPLCPTIYGFKELYKQKEDYTGVVVLKEVGKAVQQITDFDQICEMFEERLRTCLDELFDPDIPFTETEDIRTCSYCPFASLCGK